MEQGPTILDVLRGRDTSGVPDDPGLRVHLLPKTTVAVHGRGMRVSAGDTVGTG